MYRELDQAILRTQFVVIHAVFSDFCNFITIIIVQLLTR